MARGLDARSFNRPSFLPQSYFQFSEGTDTSWMPNKNPSNTNTKKACTFTIESILSLDPGKVTQNIQHVQQPGGGAYHPAMLTWAHHGDFNISLQPIQYPQPSGYNQPNGYNRVMFNDAGCRCSFSRRKVLRRSCRRIRTIYTEDQLTKLEDMFSKQRYMTGTEKMLLASALRLTETQIKVWFQNRRTRWRKSHGDLHSIYNGGGEHCAL